MARRSTAFHPAKRITPYRLWIGSEQDSRNTTAAARQGVGLIVNCTRNIPTKVPGVRHYRVPVHDAEDESGTLQAHLLTVVPLIDEHLRRGEAVLVHCYAGVSRSASVVAAFLMYREGLSARQAIARIRRLKPETFQPAANFMAALEAWQGAMADVSHAGTVTARTRGAAASTRASRAAR